MSVTRMICGRRVDVIVRRRIDGLPNGVKSNAQPVVGRDTFPKCTQMQRRLLNLTLYPMSWLTATVLISLIEECSLACSHLNSQVHLH